MGSSVAAAVGNQFLDQLTEPAEVGIFTGTMVHLLGLIVALFSGIVALAVSSEQATGVVPASQDDPGGP